MALKATCKTLAKVADDEPIFVLRAQDMLAAETVRHWVQLARENGVSVDKLNEACVCAEKMDAWPNRKFPT